MVHKYTYPHGPNPEEESLKLRAKLASQPPRPPEECGSLIRDPAIEKFGWIRENPDIYFKFKPRSVRNAVISLLVIPFGIWFYLKKSEQWKDIKEGKPPRPFF